MFKTAVISKKGGRKINEDYFDFFKGKEHSCWVIADGLGGHVGGEVASRIAVNTIIKTFKDKPDISYEAFFSYLKNGQDALHSAQKNDMKLSRMRTTIVILASNKEVVRWAHVGDSRLYYFKGGKLVFQTMDHSVPQALVKAGEISKEEIRFHEDRNRLLRAMGMQKEIKFDIEKQSYLLEKDDVFLLCSDGFWEYIDENEMEIDLKLSKNPKKWLKIMEKRILQRVNTGNDNYTAAAVFFK